ncbi:hypothetical protein NIM72_04685 [Pantoea sp. B550]|uniref:hypothetical protein n=1 Tax=Pantoea sp. B550 TaxID=2959338 RepID=UPI00209CCA2D|nr:hypothetical protein [Pantoea sp. B550]MCP1204849.1 hypothetical protein [Pantoea sp. B550]
MPDTYRVTVTTKSGETHEGLMNRSQPEMINGFIGVAREDGTWVYLAQDDVIKLEYVPEPVTDEQPSEKGTMKD